MSSLVCACGNKKSRAARTCWSCYNATRDSLPHCEVCGKKLKRQEGKCCRAHAQGIAGEGERLTMTERDRYGVIATLVDPKTSERFVFEGQGTVMAATRQIVDYCDLNDLRVICLSSPMSIYQDLKQRRSRSSNELQWLGRIGRRDLLYRPEKLAA